MKLFLYTLPLLVLTGAAAEAAEMRISVDREQQTADVVAKDLNLARLLEAAEIRSGVFVSGSIPEADVTMTLRDVPLTRLVEEIVTRAGLEWRREGRSIVVLDGNEPTVTLDVVKEDARAIIESMARQCGIRNVMIDDDVDVRATFRLLDVPCSQAFDVVLSTLGIDAELHTNSVLVARGGL